MTNDERDRYEEQISELENRIEDLEYENRQLRIQLRDVGLQPNV